jgi:hypothetical protein
MFQALKHKISLRENYFLPRGKLKFIEKKIFFYLYFSRLNHTFYLRLKVLSFGKLQKYLHFRSLNRTFAGKYDTILKKMSLFMRLASGDMGALSDTYPRH